jgi:phosphatidylglycerophosphate synthase
VLVSIVLDCLDGMQARKTGRTSKLGEVLDHSLDSANVPLCACATVLTVFPDDFTILISIICGSLIYNAQLVIYRHVHIFVLPPLTGPAAQALAAGALMFFGVFFRCFSRHDYPVRVFLVIFYIVGNLAQLQNTFFYTKALMRTPGTMTPHLRFTATMLLHASLLLAGWVTPIEWLLSAIVIAYRCNGKYVLDTLQHFKAFGPNHTKEQVRKEDTQWRWEVIGALLLMVFLALTTGTGSATKALEGEGAGPLASTSFTGLPLVTDSLFHLVFYVFIVGCVALNVWDLKQAMPLLATK